MSLFLGSCPSWAESIWPNKATRLFQKAIIFGVVSNLSDITDRQPQLQAAEAENVFGKMHHKYISCLSYHMFQFNKTRFYHWQLTWHNEQYTGIKIAAARNGGGELKIHRNDAAVAVPTKGNGTTSFWLVNDFVRFRLWGCVSIKWQVWWRSIARCFISNRNYEYYKVGHGNHVRDYLEDVLPAFLL